MLFALTLFAAMCVAIVYEIMLIQFPTAHMDLSGHLHCQIAAEEQIKLEICLISTYSILPFHKLGMN